MGIPNKLSPLTGGEDILPNGYLIAEFLESTGSQYILTDYKASSNTGCEAKVAITSYNSAPTAGCNANGVRWYIFSAENQNLLRFGFNGNLDYSKTVELNHAYNIRFNWKNSKSVVVDNSTLGTLSNNSFTSGNIIMFGYSY